MHETPREMIESADYITLLSITNRAFQQATARYWVVVCFTNSSASIEITERIQSRSAAMVLVVAAFALIARMIFTFEAERSPVSL